MERHIQLRSLPVSIELEPAPSDEPFIPEVLDQISRRIFPTLQSIYLFPDSEALQGAGAMSGFVKALDNYPQIDRILLVNLRLLRDHKKALSEIISAFQPTLIGISKDLQKAEPGKIKDDLKRTLRAEKAPRDHMIFPGGYYPGSAAFPRTWNLCGGDGALFLKIMCFKLAAIFPDRFKINRMAARILKSEYPFPVEPECDEPPGRWNPWRHALLDGAGNVFPGKTLRIPMGNVLDRPFAEIWNSLKYQRLREKVVRGEL